LQAHDFLCAGRFTAADVAVGYALLLAEHLGLAAQFPEAVTHYWQRLQARDAFQRALAAPAPGCAGAGRADDASARHSARHLNRFRTLLRS
jgi:glutathione S-transferase